MDKKEFFNEVTPEKVYIDERNYTEKEIKDSGERRVFESGAVRDIQKGKGRCDLLPLDVCGELIESQILIYISDFQINKKTSCLYAALNNAIETEKMFPDWYTMLLEVSKHFEAGAEKYGEYNWQKGLPVECYIDSAVRHYLKWKRGDQDEPHDRAFVWNLICCCWTVKNWRE